MNFYTSDLHFFHKKIIQYENRPFKDIEEMNATLIANWNKKVGRGDCAYILGDFGFCSGKEANHLLDQLNGQKYLVKGNHDHSMFDKDFDKSKFVWIKDYHTLIDDGKRIVLFHFPIAVWDRQHHGSVHLYGHIHSNGNTRHPLTIKLKNAYNVGTDCWNYEPVTLKEILNKKI